LGVRFSVPIQTDAEAHTVSFTKGTGSFPGVKRPGRGVEQPPPTSAEFKPLNSKLNPICHLMALLGAHHILHVSRIRVKEIVEL